MTVASQKLHVGEEPRTHNPCRARSAVVRRSTSILEGLLKEYRVAGQPLEVSFRNMVGPIPATDLTHSMYPYPARLLRHIPRFFLRCSQLVDSDTVVLDPFCGSGTVMVEAQAAGVRSCGIDCNPFARLLTKVKTTPLEADKAISAGNKILERSKTIRAGDIPDVVNVDLWYAAPIKRALGRLRRAIFEATLSEPLHRFMLVCLGLVADRCSLRDRRIPVPVRHRDWKAIRFGQRPTMVWDAFTTTLYRAARLSGSLGPSNLPMPIVIGQDAGTAVDSYRQHASGLGPLSLVITSPPYGAAQKYVRSTCLALGWTGLARSSDLARLDRLAIGCEHVRRHEIDNLDVPNEKIHELVRAIARSRSDTRQRFMRSTSVACPQLLVRCHNSWRHEGRSYWSRAVTTVSGRLVATHELLSLYCKRLRTPSDAGLA